MIKKNPLSEFTAIYGVNPIKYLKSVKENPLSLAGKPYVSKEDCRKYIETAKKIEAAYKAQAAYNQAFQNMKIKL